LISVCFLEINSKLERKCTSKDISLRYGKENILFIDDELPILDIYNEMLTCFGYSVTVENSCEKAFKIFLQNPCKFDLVITDQTMPVMTGMGIAEKIKKVRKDIPIILFTGLNEPIELINKNGKIVDQVILKPVQMNFFLKIIRDILDKRVM